MRPYPSAIPVTAPSKRPSTTRIPSTLSSAATKCISDVPGLPKQTSTPDPTSVRKRLSAPFMPIPHLKWCASYEGTQSRNGLADDQSVHLSCALVRVYRFRIGHESTNVVFEKDAVAAQQFAGIADRFAALDRTERLCERGVLVLHQSLILQLRQAQHPRLGRGDI